MLLLKRISYVSTSEIRENMCPDSVKGKITNIF